MNSKKLTLNAANDKAFPLTNKDIAVTLNHTSLYDNNQSL